jgi:hypothetical protein
MDIVLFLSASDTDSDKRICSIQSAFPARAIACGYGSRPGSVKWSPNADLNGNLVVDPPDAVTLTIHHNQQYP